MWRRLLPTTGERIRVWVAVSLGVVFAGTLIAELSHPVKAPILMLCSGGFILTAVFPQRRPHVNDWLLTGGTSVALVSSWYWLLAATGGQWASPLATVFFSTAALAIVILVLTALFFGLRTVSTMEDPFEVNRTAIMRRVRARLVQVSSEVSSTPWSQYSRYDGNIHMLFLSALSLLNTPHVCTYYPEEHSNLLENYLCEILYSTATIAVTKHPEQCKYGEIADNLAKDAELYLHRIKLITCLDPMPCSCPQCGVQLPAHKANCMAAICWRCKYPTPPRDSSCTNESVITPVCHLQFLCAPRGEQRNPETEVVPRVSLPFSIPQSYDDIIMPKGPSWPRNKKDCQRLLDNLHHD